MSDALRELDAVGRLLARLVSVPSLSGEEERVADVLAGYVEGHGLRVSRHDNNLWFELGDGPHGLLLNSHLDVVPPSEGHPFPPFEPVVEEGQLHGRGSVDAKASVAAMTTAVLDLAAEGWRPEGGRVVAAFTACEERGWPYNGLAETRAHLPECAAAIVGEPTELAPCIAQKGLLILKVTAEGRTAHAARPELGENAILRAARDLARLDGLALERVHPVLGRVTVTPTVIEGGRSRNVIPDRCTFYLDVRSTPSYSHAELTRLISEGLESRVDVHSDRLIPVDTDPSERIVRAALSAADGRNAFGSPTLSDWIFLKDLPVVKMGPGQSERSHTPTERIDLSELTRAVRVYRNLIQAYFSHE